MNLLDNHGLMTEASQLLKNVITLRNDVYREGNEIFHSWKRSIDRKLFVGSAGNLAYYVSLRRRDTRAIDEALVAMGFSPLSRLDYGVLNHLDLLIFHLSKIIGTERPVSVDSLNYSHYLESGTQMLKNNSNAIFGEINQNRYSRIMVTLPEKAANNVEFIRKLILQGMNVARINCAHGNEEMWSRMILNIRKAEKELNRGCKIFMDISGPKVRIEQLLITKKNSKVFVGDAIFLTGKKPLQDFNGIGIVCGCNMPEVISNLSGRDSVLVDDGKIEAHVEAVLEDGVIVRVDKCLKKGLALKPEKGLNFPNSCQNIDILTEKDKKDLIFICQNADIIGFSFVNNAGDITACRNEIKKIVGEERSESISLVAKIETAEAVKHLADIIVAGAGKNQFGILIARGDLAVEAGYLRLAELQEEILSICKSANIPVIWATQVLESMVKTGIPARAEITDAFMGGRTECVMLNKGEFIMDGLKALDYLLINSGGYPNKKSTLGTSTLKMQNING